MRSCAHCGRPLDPSYRPNQRFCCQAHKAQFWQERRKEAQAQAGALARLRQPDVLLKHAVAVSLARADSAELLLEVICKELGL